MKNSKATTALHSADSRRCNQQNIYCI